MGKLKPAPPRERADSKVGMTPKSQTLKGVYFRLTRDEISRLIDITRKVNEISQKKISKTKVIQALIQIGSPLGPKKILKSIGDTL